MSNWVLRNEVETIPTTTVDRRLGRQSSIRVNDHHCAHSSTEHARNSAYQYGILDVGSIPTGSTMKVQIIHLMLKVEDSEIDAVALASHAMAGARAAVEPL